MGKTLKSGSKSATGTTKQHVPMPKPSWLGSGYASKGAKTAEDRKKKLKEQLDKI